MNEVICIHSDTCVILDCLHKIPHEKIYNNNGDWCDDLAICMDRGREVCCVPYIINGVII